MNTLTITFFFLALFVASVRSFLPIRTSSVVLSPTNWKSDTNTRLKLLPPILSESSSFNVAISDDLVDVLKYVIIVASFGGGLIPAAIAGNKAMFETLAGTRRGGEEEVPEDYDPKTNFDPTMMDTKNRAYVESSGASGPELPGSALLFPNERIPLVDVIAIIGRIQNVDSLADWANLPSTTWERVSTTNPPMWLPRATFKVNMRKAKFQSWPVDPKTGEPVGGEELKRAEEKRISKTGALIGDAALDAVWDTWAWGASVTTPDKVDATLKNYHSTADTFKLGDFTSAAIRGRSITGLSAVTFIAIQVIVYGALFVAPALRQYANIDIGFGEIGYCDPETCFRIFS
eukprot:CAMPEP_0178910946 /NCGR_PEP_ID=MMETSP0786-20121207/9389_1 /TAXON_ID=186022 /ORGANISM="Thalassionema frauenfeldii, Strain CCMP 1798" /LENGTH=345 /DNA_ID=CAMNT_0020583273 /DNA_START=64 /DNA_END=1101 /DNA_ORIENTATION=-